MKKIEIANLKNLDSYKKELLDIYNDIGVSLATDTLIGSDMHKLIRAEELMVLIEFLEGRLKPYEEETI